MTINRAQITRLVFTIYLVLLIYKYFNEALVGQQLTPLFYAPNVNFSYWLFRITGISQMIFDHNILIYLLNFLLFFSCLALIIKPRWFFCAIIFVVSIWIYQMLMYSIVTYQSYAIGLLFPCIPFMFKKDFKFQFTFEAGRYFLCGLYFLGGFFKIKNGAIFYISHLSDSIRYSVADFMFQNPDSFQSTLMTFFINNEMLSWTLYLLVVILEMSFIIGFFTKKYDIILICLFFLFHLGNAIIMDIPFLNHLIIVTFLIPISINTSQSLKPSV